MPVSTRAAIEKLAGLCQKRLLPSGETLFVKGDKGDALYGIRRGQIRIETSTPAGDSLTLNVLGPGDLFGEIALFDGQPRTADAVAAEASELFVLRRSDFLAYLEKDARVAVRVIELLCQRIRWVSDRMEETALLPFQVRLARRLAILVQDFGMEIHISQDRSQIMSALRARRSIGNCRSGAATACSTSNADASLFSIATS